MSSYQLQTDTTHKIKLESHLIYALWMYKRAHAGQEAQLEVKTSLVGNGAKIKITCKNDSGKKLDKVEGVVFNNKYEGTVLIPDTIKPDEMVFFEAELPKHGLKGESNLIPVRPAIQVTKTQWDRAEVKRKDVVTLTCQFQSGVEDGDDAIVLIFEHNPNSCDIKIVSIPTVIKGNKIEMQWEFDYQDDTAQIPTDNEMQKYKKNYANPHYYFVVVVDGVKIGEHQESGLMRFKETVEIAYVDESGAQVGGIDYIIHLPDGTQRRGTTNDRGNVSENNVIPGKLQIEFLDNESVPPL